VTVRRTAARAAAAPVAAAAMAAVLVLGSHAGLQAHRDASDAAVPIAAVVADPFGAPKPTTSGAPTRLRVPAIGVDTALAPLHLDADGALVPPRDFALAGWYADGTAPGDVGPAVIAGHVDSRRGPAIFFRLREVARGDRIEVTRGGATVAFTVARTAWYPKTTFPTVTVYGPTPDRQLRLITCGGDFDRSLRSYRDNLVVYAVAG
jgi:sortase (surface protein transpeptidase)